MKTFRLVALTSIALGAFFGMGIPNSLAQVSGATDCKDDLYVYDATLNKCVCRWGYFETPLKREQAPVGRIHGDICAIAKLIGLNTFGGLFDAAAAMLMVLVVASGVMSIVIGGYYYMTAGGSADRVRTAKVWIGSAILGIVIALLAWTILYAISPNLV